MLNIEPYTDRIDAECYSLIMALTTEANRHMQALTDKTPSSNFVLVCCNGAWGLWENEVTIGGSDSCGPENDPLMALFNDAFDLYEYLVIPMPLRIEAKNGNLTIIKDW